MIYTFVLVLFVIVVVFWHHNEMYTNHEEINLCGYK